MVVFNEIIKLYSEIFEIYRQLLKLEDEGKINDDKFLGLISLLKYKINKETVLFNIFINNYKKDYDEVLMMIEEQEDDFEPYVSKRLYDYMSVFEKNNISVDNKFSSEDEVVNAATKRLGRIYDCYSKDLCLVYLSFLGDYINSRVFNSIKKYILGFKYNDGLVNHDMEYQLIENNFNISKINYIDMNVVSMSLGVGIQLNEEIRYMVCDDAIKSSVMQMLSFNDSDYMDDYVRACSISAGCMFRAGLLLLSDNKDVYDMEISNISKMIYESFNFYNGLSIEIIKATIGCIEKDKNRVRKISVRSYND